MSIQKNEVNLKKITSHCKEYGFVYGSSEIYDGLNAAYDYGPNGVLLKNNIKEFWWKSMVQGILLSGAFCYFCREPLWT